MAYRGGVNLAMAMAVVLARAATAAGPCEEERGRTGFAVAQAPGGVTVAAVDDDSAARSGGLRVGDALVQVNGTVPRSCGDFARAVRDARHDHKALLVLATRADGEVPLVLAAATWDRAVVVVAPAPPAEAPSVRALVTSTPSPTLPQAVHVSLADVLQAVAALAATEPTPGRLARYQAEVRRLHVAVATLAARQAVPPPVAGGLETVLRYHDAAAVAWAAEDAVRERDRRPRHLPAAEATAAPFFSDSGAAATIEEFPFLRETVVRDPRPGGLGGESAGLWRPSRARTLLWEHARGEQERLAAWLGMASR